MSLIPGTSGREGAQEGLLPSLVCVLWVVVLHGPAWVTEKDAKETLSSLLDEEADVVGTGDPPPIFLGIGGSLLAQLCVTATPDEPRPLTGGSTERQTSCSKSLFFPKPWGLWFRLSLLVEEPSSLEDEPLCPLGALRGDRPVEEGCVVPSGAQVRVARGKAWSRALGLGWVQPPASRATADLECESHGGSECP